MKVEVCLGQNCKAYGAVALIEELENCGTDFEITECRSLCPHAPVIFIDGRAKLKVKLEELPTLKA